MKKISLFGAVSTGVGMLIATSCFVSSASGSSAVGTPFVIAIVIACIANMLAVMSIDYCNDGRRLFNKQCFRRTCRRCDVRECNDGNDG